MRGIEYYLPIIEFYVSENYYNVLNNVDLNDLISKIKDNRGLKSRERSEIKDFLIKHFVKKQISGNLYQFIDNTDILDISSAISRSSFYSYQTSLYIHSLANKLSKNIYLVKERKEVQNQPLLSLTQNGINQAFNKLPRVTSDNKKIEDFVINFVTGQFQKYIGVMKYKQYLISDIERSLIDSVVRPFYSGGVQCVLQAFLLAKEKIDIEKLYRYYSQMNFTYPYHQAIGFYLETSGYDKNSYKNFYNHEIFEFDFYLDYNIKKQKYNKKWKMYYPDTIKIK